MHHEDSIKDVSRLLQTISTALIEAGCSANRLESLASKIGNDWQADVQCYAAQTTVIMTIKKDGLTHHSITRINRWVLNLDRIQEINDFIIESNLKKYSVEQALQELERIAQKPLPYNHFIQTIAGAGASAGLVYILKGNLLDIGIGFILGMVLSLLQVYFNAAERFRYLGDFLTSFIVSILALFAKEVLPSLNENTVMIGCIVLIMPGLLFLNAVHEIALKNLISGNAKLVEAMVITMSISFGIAAAVSLYRVIGVL